MSDIVVEVDKPVVVEVGAQSITVEFEAVGLNDAATAVAAAAEAAASATSAATHDASSATHDSAAAVSATNAASSATASAASATSAATHDTSSAAHDAAAATSATNAAGSATASAASATSAATSDTNATAAWNQFNAEYLGPKAADPTVSNTGGALVSGMLYWSTSLSQLRIYGGAAWAGYSPTAGDMLKSVYDPDADGVIAIAQGGTGAATATAARTALGLGNVTNDAQTKAAIVPNTAPAAGALLVGNAGATAYAPVAVSGDGTLASTGALAVTNQVRYSAAQALTAAQQLQARQNVGAGPGLASCGRLTLSSGTPVMGATVSGAGTIYFTPYMGSSVLIYNGTLLVPYNFTELSQTLADTTKSPAAAGASSVYDLFVWNDAGTLRCTRGPTWAAGAVAGSNTQRGTGAGSTELQRINGILTNKNAITNGPGANLGTYVGTIATNGSSTVDWTLGTAATGGGAAVLNVWNMYNRVPVATVVRDSTSSWTYNSSTWRSADASTSNRITFVRGLEEGAIDAFYQAAVTPGTSSDVETGIGLDSTSAPSGIVPYANTGALTQAPAAWFRGLPGLGSHFVQAIERQVTVASAAIFFGNSAGLGAQTQGLSFSGLM